MKPNSDNELDFLFKSKLTTERHSPVFVEEEWESMESILSPQPRKKKRGMIWLYRVSGGMAASLLLYLSVHFIQHNPGKPMGGSSAKTGYTVARPDRENAGIVTKTNKITSHPNSASHILYGVAKEAGYHIHTKNTPVNVELADSAEKIYTTLQTLSLAVQNSNLHINESLTPALAIVPAIIDPATGLTTLADHQKPATSVTTSAPRFALTVLAAPDVNGVSSFHNEQTGLNLAVGFSLKLSPKLSITTGAAYAIKPYQTGLSNYRTNSPGWSAGLWTSNAKPNTVNANCYVLDVPLNINYQLYNKGRNSFTVGTGLSSYIMLKEDYRFNFPDPAKDGVDVDISNQNQHLLGILNMNVNYQHQLNNKLGLVVQPYLKLPLTQIGFGQVGLQSAGVAVGFNWNVR
ncbi:hypothetical protein ACFGVR_22950 [Mucilaginibacter sp. AW1-3]